MKECLLSFGTELFVLQFAIQKHKIKIFRTTVLLFLNKFETWSLTLREERRLRLLENRVLRGIF